MKNPIALFLKTTLIILNSNFMLPMQTIYKTDNIDLMLPRKPNNISTYDWCKMISKKYLKQNRSKLLQCLDISKEDFKEIKRILIEKIECNIKEPNSDQLKEKEDYQINNAIKETLKNTTLTNALGIKKLFTLSESMTNKDTVEILGIPLDQWLKENKNDIIILAERENCCPVKFIKTFKNNNSISFTDGHNIFTSTKAYSEIKDWLKECSLEAHIGHEFAHILCKHFIEKSLLESIYELQITKKENKFPKFELDLLLTKFIVATEIQADIIGIFNSKKWAKDQYNCYFILEEETKSSNYKNYSDNKHPSFKERSNYFKEIYKYMEKEPS